MRQAHLADALLVDAIPHVHKAITATRGERAKPDRQQSTMDMLG
jgi:hypothetical protein